MTCKPKHNHRSQHKHTRKSIVRASAHPHTRKRALAEARHRAHAHGAVSYTHLTLPTICSV
eukprot:6997961-Alexandrium_andersonii.AAC.1